MTTPAKALYDSLAARVASDPAKLGLATFLSVVPIIAPYVPGLGLVFGDLALGADDLAPVDADALPVSGVDPLTSQYRILIPPPSGGFTWVYGGVTPPPPVIVYGYALIDANTHGILFGVTMPLAVPETLAGPALLTVDEISFTMLAPPLI